MAAPRDVMRLAAAKAAVRLALDEDLGSPWCDATSEALVDPAATATGEIYAKGAGCVVAGATVARAVLKAVDPRVSVRILRPDGSAAKPGVPILAFRGRARSILAAERTALNFMQRMCATATLARRFVDATKRYGTLILDTRKTTPGLRVFEKYAVTCGGGTNHRFGMFDRILMKDNHRRLWRGGDPDALDQAVAAARKAFPKLAVEVEVESLRECASALRARPEWIMLDNMSCADMRKCVRMCRGISKTEASGGITLDRAKEVAATGVTAISLGCLTHSAGSVDLSLEWSVV
ncbi:MAG: carboxylating nicotinate-nucleotide diphosphorylase [Kiritimatiellae bacterium]|nr:carboxylating nicotinate-nucleotide diphosphorylase [Kiritimatiellia bacterium]MBQ3343932.1 carboxylating nicotinate-nucleotide diphosphorylase [Kiritimatiellia bacterium]